MSAAFQVYYTRFDATFFKLPPLIRARIESRIDEMGLRLATFSHHRLALGSVPGSMKSENRLDTGSRLMRELGPMNTAPPDRADYS